MKTILVLLMGAFVLSGCGASAYDIHSYTALAVRDGTNTLRDSVRAHHRATVAQGTRIARVEGEPQDTFDERRRVAGRSASALWRTAHATWLDAQRTLAGTSTAYSNAVLASLLGQAGDLSRLMTIGTNAVRAFFRLLAILRREHIPDLPQLPDGVASFFGVTPDAPSTGAAQ